MPEMDLTQSIVDHLPDAVLVVDVHGSVVFTNPAARELWDLADDLDAWPVIGGLLPGLSDWPGVLQYLQAGDTFPLPTRHLWLELRTSTLVWQGADHWLLSLRPGTAPADAPDLQAENALLRSVLDHLPAMVACFDAQSRYRFVNATYGHWLQRPLETIIGQPALEVFHLIDSPQHQALLQRAMAGESFRYRSEREFIPGDRRSLDVQVIAHRDEQDRFLGWFSLASDITEYTQLEQEIARGRDELHLIIDHLPALIAHLDLNLRHRFVNRTFEAWYYRPASSVVGRHLNEVVKAAHYQRLLPLLERARQGEVVSVDMCRDDPHLKQRDVNVSVIPQQGDDGSLLGFYLLVIDQTEERRIARQLEESEARYRLLFQHAALPIFLINLCTLRYEDCNPAAERFFGYRRAEVLQQQVGFLSAERQLDGRSTASVVADLLANRQDQVLFSREWRCRLASGEERTVELHGLVMSWCDDQFLHLSVVDITARKHTEAYLRQAQQSAEEANRAKSAFLASISHEIRTPLNAVLGMGELLLSSEVPPREQEYIRVMRTSGQQLMALIDDVLDLSKIEAGQLELDQAPFDLRQCIEDVLDLLTRRAAEKHLELGGMPIAEPGVAPWLHFILLGDALRLRQILLNLLSNAVKFCHEGGVLLTVSHRCLPGPTPQVALTLAVSDTGIGIAPEHLAQLFQPFQQAHSGIVAQFGGTGLGLAIAQQLCEAMGGQIEAHSRPGVGTTITVQLQLPLQGEFQPEVQSGAQVLAGKRLLLLVPTLQRQVLEYLATCWKMQVQVCDDPAKAREYLPQVDMVILGARNQATAEILARALLPDPLTSPVPLLLSVPDAAAATPVAPFTVVLPRPLTPPRILNSLREALGETALTLAMIAPTKHQLDAHMAERLPRRILAADDNPANCQVLDMLLTRLGYTVELVNDGQAALQAIGHKAYQVVLMDMVMPGMDGLETTRRIRTMDLAAQPYIVGVTANVTPEDRRRCLEAGMDDYLSKPVSVAGLISVLERSAGADVAVATAVLPSSDEQMQDYLLGLQAVFGEEEPWREFLRLSQQSVETQRQSLDTALAAGEWDTVVRAVHTLKSTAGNVGAGAMRSYCETLERGLREGRGIAPEERQVLAGYCQRLQETLVRLLQHH